MPWKNLYSPQNLYFVNMYLFDGESCYRFHRIRLPFHFCEFESYLVFVRGLSLGCTEFCLSIGVDFFMSQIKINKKLDSLICIWLLLSSLKFVIVWNMIYNTILRNCWEPAVGWISTCTPFIGFRGYTPIEHPI